MSEVKIQFIETWSKFILETFNLPTKDVAIYIACQFALESKFGTSRLAKEQNNIAGMKSPKARPTTCIDNSDTFAKYSSIENCVIDYFLCLAYHKTIRFDFVSIPRFIASVMPWYCPESDYTSKIQFIYSQFKNSHYE